MQSKENVLNSFRAWLNEHRKGLSEDVTKPVTSSKRVRHPNGRSSVVSTSQEVLFRGERNDLDLICSLVSSWSPKEPTRHIEAFYINGLFYDAGTGVYFSSDYETFSESEHFYSLLYQALAYLCGAYLAYVPYSKTWSIIDIEKMIQLIIRDRFRVELIRDREGNVVYPTYRILPELTTWFLTSILNGDIEYSRQMKMTLNKVTSLIAAKIEVTYFPYLYSIHLERFGLTPMTSPKEVVAYFIRRDLRYVPAPSDSDIVIAHNEIVKTLSTLEL